MKKNFFIIAALFTILTLHASTLPQPKAHISIKQPGNPAVTYDLHSTPKEVLPVEVETKMFMADDNEAMTYEVTIKAKSRTVYFNFGAELSSGFSSDDCEYYMPGFWYHRNRILLQMAKPSWRISCNMVSLKRDIFTMI